MNKSPIEFGINYEPLRFDRSGPEMEKLLFQWMIKNHGDPHSHPFDPELRDQWYRDYAMIDLFIRDSFPSEP